MNALEQSYTDRISTRILVQEVLDDVRDAVVTTLGPNSLVALIIDNNEPVITKDGVRVMSGLDYNEIRKNAIAGVVKQACQRTDQIVGDGTTTTAFMVCELFKYFKDRTTFNDNQMVLSLIEKTKESIINNTTFVDAEHALFRKMAATSANYHDDIVDTVVNIYQKYNRPYIDLKTNSSLSEDKVEVIKNISFTARWPFTKLAPGKGEVALEVGKGFPVLLIDDGIERFDNDKLNKIYDYGYNSAGSILVIAKNFGPDCSTQFEYINAKLNKDKGTEANIYVIPYTVEAIGNMGSAVINDIATLLGINVITSQNVLPDELSTTDVSFIISSMRLELDSEVALIKERAEGIVKELEKSFNRMTIKERLSVLGLILNDRISRLNGQKINLQVTGITASEASERTHLFEDAIRACESALKFGVIPGIGWGLVQAAIDIRELFSGQELDDNGKYVVDAFINVLTAQYELLNNVQYDFHGDNFYYNQITGERSKKPVDVMDNGYSAIVAIESAWSIVNRLSKLSCIMGKSNYTYGVR